MNGNDLIKFTEKYLKEFPNMADQDIIVTMPRKRCEKGNYYRRFKITSIGMNSLVGKDCLNLGIETVS